jgi:hypothetical protein
MGRPRHRPRHSCHSKNIPDPTMIAEPTSKAADGMSPHTINPNMIAHTSEK